MIEKNMDRRTRLNEVWHIEEVEVGAVCVLLTQTKTAIYGFVNKIDTMTMVIEIVSRPGSLLPNISGQWPGYQVIEPKKAQYVVFSRDSIVEGVYVEKSNMDTW